MKKRLGRFALNAVLVLSSVIITYGICELAFRSFLPYCPPAVYNLLPRAYQPFGQSSKRGLVPEPPYLVIIGDSYAAGDGEWFIENNYNRRTRYQAAHLLQAALGWDVLPLAWSGGGNFQAYQHAYNVFLLTRGTRLELPLPDSKIFYFFAGNDLQDNIIFSQRNDRFFSMKGLGDHPLEDLASGKAIYETERVYAAGRVYPPEKRFLLLSIASSLLNGWKVKAAPMEKKLHAATWELLPAEERDLLTANWSVAHKNLTEEELALSLAMLDASLMRLMEVLPTRDSIFVYIPAPFVCYPLSGPQQSALADNEDLKNMVTALGEKHGWRTVDATPSLQAAARHNLVHGPRDLWHLNKAGYTALADLLLHSLQNGR